MLACLLAGLAEANIAIAQSAIADLAPPAQRGRLFGYVYLSSSLAYVAGPLAGGKLADPGIVSWFGDSTPYWAVALMLLATLALTAARFRETHAATAAAPIGPGRVARRADGSRPRLRQRRRRLRAGPAAPPLPRQLHPLPGYLRLLPRLPDLPGRPLRDGDLARVGVHRLGRDPDRHRQPRPGRLALRQAGSAPADDPLRAGAGRLPGGSRRAPPRRRALGDARRLRPRPRRLPARDGGDDLHRRRPRGAGRRSRLQPVAPGRRRGALGRRRRRPGGNLDGAAAAGNGCAGAGRLGPADAPRSPRRGRGARAAP